MNDSMIIRINTILFFFGWTFIMLLGADFPPPIGFIWVVLLICVLDIIQYKYLYFFLKQIHKKRKNLFLLNLIFFFFGGVIISIFTLAVSSSALLIMNSWDIIIWISCVISVGVLYGVFFWVFNQLLLAKVNYKN